MSDVFIAFQDNEDSRPIIEAILMDNTKAKASYPTGLVRIVAPNRLVIRRESIEELTGADYNLQQIHVSLVTLSGHIDEDDHQFSLSWTH